MGWLVDTSALRPHVPAFAEILILRVAAGLVSVCLVTELEVGYSARSGADLIAEVTGQPTEWIVPPL